MSGFFLFRRLSLSFVGVFSPVVTDLEISTALAVISGGPPPR